MWCQGVLAERETKLAAAEEAARAATVAARDRAAAAQSAQQEVERTMTAQRQQLQQVNNREVVQPAGMVCTPIGSSHAWDCWNDADS